MFVVNQEQNYIFKFEGNMEIYSLQTASGSYKIEVCRYTGMLNNGTEGCKSTVIARYANARQARTVMSMFIDTLSFNIDSVFVFPKESEVSDDES